MMNVSDARFVKGSAYDFEEYSSVEIDSWTTTTTTTTTTATSQNSSIEANCSKDDSIITIFTQSIEIIGNSISPWPAASSKTIPEQVAGIFIKSEAAVTSPKDETVQSRLEANKPQIQSKLRRSTSTARRFSLTRINEETFYDSQKLYNELEPIPIVTLEEKQQQQQAHNTKVSAEVALFDNHRKGSRLQNWLASLYYRNNASQQQAQASPKSNIKIDEESGIVEGKPAPKGILKATKSENVQKSASIPETEAIKMSHPTKKTMKLRFDNEVSVCETFHKEDYSRQSLDYVARQLTPSLAMSIKKELNAVKQEMEVHEESRHLTQFYLIK